MLVAVPVVERAENAHNFVPLCQFSAHSTNLWPIELAETGRSSQQTRPRWPNWSGQPCTVLQYLTLGRNNLTGGLARATLLT